MTNDNPPPARINTFLPGAILAGIWTAQKLNLSMPAWLGAAFSSLLLFLIANKKAKNYVLEQPVKRVSRGLFLLTFFCAAGTWTVLNTSGNAASAGPTPLPEEITVSGVIQQPPEIRTNRTYFEIRPDRSPGQDPPPFSGNVMAVVYWAEESYQYGDRISLTGKPTLIRAGSPASYFRYLRQQGFGVMMYSPRIEKLSENNGNPLFTLIFRLRALLLEKVYRIYPAPENALMAGILLGDESRIPSDIEDAFQRTGTAHVVAISGANFAVLTWLLMKMIHLLIPRWWGQLTLIPVVFFYAVLTGGNPAILRAALMGSFTIFGLTLGRKTNGIRSLLWSITAIALFNPGALFEISLQLSATATIGILLFKDPMRRLVTRLLSRIPVIPETIQERIVELTDELLLISIAAQIFTVWISAAAFHQISLISLFANLLITPFQSIIMLGGLFSLLCGMVFEPAGALAAAFVWPAPAFTIRAVRFCAGIPWASGYAGISAGTAWLIIGTLLLAWIRRDRMRQWDREKLAQRGLILLFFLNILLWKTALELSDTRLRVTFSGSAASPQIQIRTPQHQIFWIAPGSTNYAAKDMLTMHWLETGRVAGAFIDFPEKWMRAEFIETTSDLPAHIYLNGIHPQPGLDTAANGLAQLKPGFHLQAGTVGLDVPVTYLKRRGWQVHYGNLHIFIPMGISMKNIQKLGREDLIASANLILLGGDDDILEWEKYLQKVFCGETQCSAAPLIFNYTQYGEPKIYSDGQKIWLFGKK